MLCLWLSLSGIYHFSVLCVPSFSIGRGDQEVRRNYGDEKRVLEVHAHINNGRAKEKQMDQSHRCTMGTSSEI